MLRRPFQSIRRRTVCCLFAMALGACAGGDECSLAPCGDPELYVVEPEPSRPAGAATVGYVGMGTVEVTMDGTEELAVFDVPAGVDLERGQAVTVEIVEGGYLVSRDDAPVFFSGADGGCRFPTRSRTPLALEPETTPFCRAVDERGCAYGVTVYSVEVEGVSIAPGDTESVVLADGRTVRIRNRKVNRGGTGPCGDFSPGHFLIDIVY